MTIEFSAEPDDQLRADVAWLGDFQDVPGVLESFIARHAPRVFALVEQDVGLLEDAVFGWGFQFDDHAFVIAGGATLHASCSHEEDAVRIFAVAGRNLRLVWHTPLGMRSAGSGVVTRRVIR
ncbi:hypothetical protein [Parafrankia sp. BMG5.11]|uniref:hypothetical protein n=1 Tax=Parafrankia sp. BMG5.11 TaxID=222540 RepID=UPI00103B75C9|nr:hypothetical protein [Parafrankia sp. BMG5.11]TCJ34626.1 hypothetical protein E0504_32010 [Parafrankia sp. BMG5.11]